LLGLGGLFLLLAPSPEFRQFLLGFRPGLALRGKGAKLFFQFANGFPRGSRTLLGGVIDTGRSLGRSLGSYSLRSGTLASLSFCLGGLGSREGFVTLYTRGVIRLDSFEDFALESRFLATEKSIAGHFGLD
jgi:hypothetical protein